MAPSMTMIAACWSRRNAETTFQAAQTWRQAMPHGLRTEMAVADAACRSIPGKTLRQLWQWQQVGHVQDINFRCWDFLSGVTQ